jgi:hypothetical protein
LRPIDASELLNLYEYERARPQMRARVIELKRRRRVPVGRYLSFVFENRETVQFQIQEMCRVERIVDPEKIAEEVEVYNSLIPRPGELSATMMIEIEDREQIQPILDKLMGIDARDYVRLQVGAEAIPGVFEAGHSDEERGKISAVHFVRFPLTESARRAFRATDVWLIVDHPNEHARTRLSEETKASLADDLLGGGLFLGGGLRPPSEPPP